MRTKLVTVCYLPPPGGRFKAASACFDNLKRWPAKHDLKIYSEHPWEGAIRLKANPEMVRNPHTQGNRFAVPNLLFLTGMRIAREGGYSHVLYLESDCRVYGKDWDERILAEYFSLGRPLLAAGTLVCYNPCNSGPLGAARWAKLVGRNERHNFPAPTYAPKPNQFTRSYGWKGAAERYDSSVFPNGAPAIYSMEWMPRLFDLESTAKVCSQMAAFDMQFGREVWSRFAEDSYEVLGFLETVYGGYGDVLTSEAERQAMLTSGQVAAAHQFKSDWTC